MTDSTWTIKATELGKEEISHQLKVQSQTRDTQG